VVIGWALGFFLVGLGALNLSLGRTRAAPSADRGRHATAYPAAAEVRRPDGARAARCRRRRAAHPSHGAAVRAGELRTVVTVASWSGTVP
jgi:hypothetical protein